MPLPVADEIRAGPLAEGKAGQTAHLVPVGHPAVILPPRGFLSVAEEVGAGDMMVVPRFGAAEAAEYSSARFVQAPSRLYASE